MTGNTYVFTEQLFSEANVQVNREYHMVFTWSEGTDATQSAMQSATGAVTVSITGTQIAQ